MIRHWRMVAVLVFMTGVTLGWPGGAQGQPDSGAKVLAPAAILADPPFTLPFERPSGPIGYGIDW